MLLTLLNSRAWKSISCKSYHDTVINNSTRETIWFKTWLVLIKAELKDIFDDRIKLLEDDKKFELEN